MGPTFFPFHSFSGYSCESTAKRLISKMEARSFESSYASAQQELDLVKRCQNVLVDIVQNKCRFHRKSLGQICIIGRRLSLSNTEDN